MLFYNTDIKISPQTLYGYENNYRKPDANILLALCDIYDLDNLLVTFGYSSREEEAQDSEENLKRSEDEEKLFLAFNKLNEAGQKKAIERVEELTEIPKYQKKKDDQ